MNVAIIGAGPAGLTAGYLLARKGVPVTILEQDPEYVGGISRTVAYKGFRFDIGGHRFFSKSRQAEALWTELLPNDLLPRPRLSRIYYRGRFFSYPLRAMDAVLKLGLLESALCVLSYIKARLRPVRNPRSFEDWVCNHFGRRLFSIFFQSYTEKVWGMSCRDISADWAAQRIKNLSLGTAILHALGLHRPARGSPSSTVTTLVESFRYPRRGPGMMWEACAEKIRRQGGRIVLGARVAGVEKANGRWRIVARRADGSQETWEADHVISSAPLKELVHMLKPAPPDAVLAAADTLRYRDFLTVVLICRGKELFPDNWLYIHEPEVLVGRIQNFKAWSEEMVPSPDLNCYGLEYFCFEGDALWSAPDAELIDRARREIEQIGLGRAADFFDGCVVRQPKAYPVYDDRYAAGVAAVRRELEARDGTLHVIGRNGMHRYNNQDHAMMTALLTVENILAGRKVYDVWSVNQDAEYIEESQVVEEPHDEKPAPLPSGPEA